MKEREGNRRYKLELGGAMLLYMVTLFVAIASASPWKPGLLRTLVLGSPILPMLLTVWAIARHFRRMDEFLRLRSLESLARGSGHRRVHVHLRLPGNGRLSQAQHVLGVGNHGPRLGAHTCAALRVHAMKNLVRELRTDRGWSQGDLADKLEVSRQTINAIETGQLRPQSAARLRHREAVRQTDRKDLSHGEITMKSKIFAGLALALSLLAPAFSAAAPANSKRRARRRTGLSDKGPPLIFIPGLASGPWVWTRQRGAAAASTRSIY